MNFSAALSSLRKMVYSALVLTIVPVSGQQKTVLWVLAGLAADWA